MDLVVRAQRALIDGRMRPAAVAVGFVDTHVHINAPGTDWEGFASATAAVESIGVDG
jgi:allantoinase